MFAVYVIVLLFGFVQLPNMGRLNSEWSYSCENWAVAGYILHKIYIILRTFSQIVMLGLRNN